MLLFCRRSGERDEKKYSEAERIERMSIKKQRGIKREQGASV